MVVLLFVIAMTHSFELLRFYNIVGFNSYEVNTSFIICRSFHLSRRILLLLIKDVRKKKKKRWQKGDILLKCTEVITYKHENM